jgi:membrane protease YdiL (CAAX protease family)
VVTFAEVGARLRQSVLFVSAAALAFVLLFELPLKAQAIFADVPNLFWLASFLAGSFFIIIVRWVDTSRSVHIFPADGKITQIVLFGLIAGAGITLWVLARYRAFVALFPVLAADIRSGLGLYAPRFIIIAVLSSTIVLPIGEELLFRGYLLPQMAERRSFPAALIMTSLLYGLRSLDPFIFFTNFGMGLLLGWMTKRLHLASAIIAHAFANLMILVYLLSL